MSGKDGSLWCLRLMSANGRSYRKRLGIELLPIVSPEAKVLSDPTYGTLHVLYIDAGRLNVERRERLIDWIWKHGDTPEREIVAENVLSNRATYLLSDDEEADVVMHDPNAWG